MIASVPFAYGYARVSHADSFQADNSLPVQEGQCTRYFDYCAALEGHSLHGVQWGGMFAEECATSAYMKRFSCRPKAQELLRRLKRGDHVIFPRIDRGFRSLLDFCEVERYCRSEGITIHFVNPVVDMSTPSGRLCAQMLAAAAEFDSAIKGERIREVVQARKERGLAVSRAPMGFKVETIKVKGKDTLQIVRDDYQRAIMQEIVRLRDQGLKWETVSERIEERLHEFEQRDYAPALHFKRKRPWGPLRCARYYKAEKKLQAAGK